MTKYIPTRCRDALLKSCMEKKLSTQTIGAVTGIVARVLQTEGHDSAERKAEELTAVVETAQSEEEIIKAIAKMA